MLDVFNRELENIKKNQTEMSTKTEMQNIIKEMKSGLDVIEEKISELEDRIMEISAVEHSKDKRTKRNKESLKDFWDKIKCITIQIIPVPKEDKQKVSEKNI